MLDGLRSCQARARALSRGQKALVGIVLVLVTLWGGSKDGAWTNNAARVANRMTVQRTARSEHAASSQATILTEGESFTASTNAVAGEVPALTTNDFERGFVLARVGTNEVFDFAPPEGATVCEKWQRRGGSSDCFRLDVPDWLWA